MRHNRHRFANHLATITMTALLAVNPASAMQGPPTADPISPQRIAELSTKRAELRRLKDELDKALGGTNAGLGVASSGERLKTIVPAIEAIQQQFLADPATLEVVVRQTAHPNLLEAAGRIGRVRQAGWSNAGGPPKDSSLMEHFQETLESELRSRGSSVEISYDEPLAMFLISGPGWEVAEAQTLMEKSLGDYVHRISEMRAREERSGDSGRRRTLSISWDGGALGELVDRVRNNTGCNVILADPSLRDLVIPPFQVQRVTPEVLFKMLETLPGPDGARFFVAVVSQSTVEPGAKSPAPDDGSMSAITISPSIRSEDSPVSRIFDLRTLATADDQKPIIDAISFAMDAANYTSKVKVRFHEPSKLLFVQGPREAIVLVGEILSARDS
jgi:hypothetical protein